MYPAAASGGRAAKVTPFAASPGGSWQGSAVSSAKHCFAPPSGCTWMYALGLRGAGTAQRNARSRLLFEQHADVDHVDVLLVSLVVVAHVEELLVFHADRHVRVHIPGGADAGEQLGLTRVDALVVEVLLELDVGQPD